MYGYIATHGWFKTFWGLRHQYGFKFEILGHNLRLLREGSELIMGKAVWLAMRTKQELIRLNRVRKHNKLFNLVGTMRADGITISPCVLDVPGGTST